MEKFDYETNGYNREQVGKFINDVVIKTEDIVKKCQIQKDEIEKLSLELKKYKDIEDSLKSALIEAQTTGDNIKSMARREADIIINDAKNNASRIVNEALLKSNKIEIEKEILEKNVNVFKTKLKLLMKEENTFLKEFDSLKIDD